jgi:hypothetical protein
MSEWSFWRTFGRDWLRLFAIRNRRCRPNVPPQLERQYLARAPNAHCYGKVRPAWTCAIAPSGNYVFGLLIWESVIDLINYIAHKDAGRRTRTIMIDSGNLHRSRLDALSEIQPEP